MSNGIWTSLFAPGTRRVDCLAGLRPGGELSELERYLEPLGYTHWNRL